MISKDVIEKRIRFNKFLKEAREAARITKCMWCGADNPDFCNSHTVPRSFLANISEKTSHYTCSYQLMKPYLEKPKLGLNESGCFKMLCKKCDSVIFRDYEDEHKILEFKNPELIMAQIAFKSTLRKLHDSIIAMSQMIIVSETEQLSCCERDQVSKCIEYYCALAQCYNDELNRIGDMMSSDNENQSKYSLIFKEVLEYKVPIAIQTSILVFEDFNGDSIKHDDEKEIQPLHIAVFPLSEKSIVLMFVHENDEVYKNLINQFNQKTASKKHEAINHLIFKYSDEFLIGETLSTEDLSPEFIHEITPSIEKICAGNLSAEEYPNLLSKEFAVK